MRNININTFFLNSLLKLVFLKAAQRWRKLLFLAFILSLFPGCVFLSNKYYVKNAPERRGIHRVVVFLQRWPVYSQLPTQNEIGAEFISKHTPFVGAFRPTDRLNPRAVDIKDVDDTLMGELILEIMNQKGYQAFLSEIEPRGSRALSVEEIMAQYQALDQGVDAFIFCFYAPTLYFSDPQMVPRDRGQRSYGLQEIVRLLSSDDRVIWGGPRAALSPKNSISHAFIYLSIACFRARDWKSLWEVADSQTSGRTRPWIPLCPPAPTDYNFPADAGMIKRLICQNLDCRLRHLIPYAY
jgi:hypothetical protein